MDAKSDSWMLKWSSLALILVILTMMTTN